LECVDPVGVGVPDPTNGKFVTLEFGELVILDEGLPLRGEASNVGVDEYDEVDPEEDEFDPVVVNPRPNPVKGTASG
jgi:hypothetical protein